jgi:hypothetical protein
LFIKIQGGLLSQKLYHKKYTKNIKTFDTVAFMTEKQTNTFVEEFPVLSRLPYRVMG